MKQFDTFTDPVFFTEVETELHPMPVPTIQQVSNIVYEANGGMTPLVSLIIV
jgi:hypothetical protein